MTSWLGMGSSRIAPEAAFCTARAAPAVMASRAALGCLLRAAVRPIAVLTGTVTTPGNAFSASAQITSSPVTSPTGTPAAAAIRPLSSASLTGLPFSRTSANPALL
jgi:hypothetical protein